MVNLVIVVVGSELLMGQRKNYSKIFFAADAYEIG